jgi:hypothetical protein
MNTMRVDIINPKALRLLKDLADMNLIVIKDNSKNGFACLLKKLRSKARLAPTYDEITKEVELHQTRRDYFYEKMYFSF